MHGEPTTHTTEVNANWWRKGESKILLWFELRCFPQAHLLKAVVPIGWRYWMAVASLTQGIKRDRGGSLRVLEGYTHLHVHSNSLLHDSPRHEEQGPHAPTTAGEAIQAVVVSLPRRTISMGTMSQTEPLPPSLTFCRVLY